MKIILKIAMYICAGIISIELLFIKIFKKKEWEQIKNEWIEIEKGIKEELDDKY